MSIITFIIKKIVQYTAKYLGVGLVRSRRLEQLQSIETDISELLDFLSSANVIDGHSKAQLHQDIFVLLVTNFKKNGFFVEFGATNGVELSNTLLLEKSYGWNGILAEPARIWHKDLLKNRKASIETNCVWKTSGDIVNFNMVDMAELSTITEFSDRDGHHKQRENGMTYDIETISLNDLLKKHNAPKQIDYLSIDTEGSEFEILNNFDFNEYNISIITCEHNYTDDREKIFSLLSSNGYTRRFTGFSKWDDWYLKD